MPNVMGREFPYTPQGMAAARQYSQAMGIRDGGSMGFRPVGYADGDVVLDDQTRSAIIEKLMDMTGMGANTFVGLSNEQLTAAVQKVEADALAAQMQQEQRSAPSAFGDARPSNQDIDREFKNALRGIDQYLGGDIDRAYKNALGGIDQYIGDYKGPSNQDIDREFKNALRGIDQYLGGDIDRAYKNALGGIDQYLQTQPRQESTSPSQRSAPSDFLGAPSDLGNARGPSDRDIDQYLQQMQQMQQLEKGANAGGVEGFVGSPQQIPNFPGVVPNEQGDGYNYYSPSEPTGMYNGGLMSLRRR